MASLSDQQPNLSFSDDDDIGNDPSSSKHQNVKRGSRACDRCRKIKSKCEAGTTTDDKCKNCEVANTPCTFQGPSFKRGPPKGYIHSIEQRWHQVECILATIMETPRAQDIIGDLRSDTFANAILDRVQRGPYGSRSRLQQPQDPNGDPYSSLIDVPEYAPMRDDRRSRRQSRVSREIVSQDPTVSAAPTREWQDQLARRLQNYSWAYTTSPLSSKSRASSAGTSNDYSRTRRKLDYPASMPTQQNWDNLYTLPDTQTGFEPGHVNETAEAFGHLSVDQNQEFRYHGPASGLPLLAQSNRKTGGDDQQEDRIWNFMANVDPESTTYDLAEEESVAVDMPSPEMQTYLLHLYFTYVHPFFPVIHKQDFLHHYNALSHSVPSEPRAKQPLQRLCKMLLLAMFAVAARYSDKPEVHLMTHGKYNVSRAGQQYAEDAHRLLDRKYQSSRPSTCQALLLLAIREFGMGAMDKGWLYSASSLEGMALRMAVDLGMNRNADNWTTDGKQPVFTDVEKRVRKHIWWSCCTSDKLSAVWLGRPITFRANDYSTPIPDIDEVDEEEPWHPYPPGEKGEYVPQPSKLMSTFQRACHLSVIITDIMDKIYPVQSVAGTSPRTLFEHLETRLSKWFIELPEHLRFSPNEKTAAVLPHVLVLYIEYHAAVLLLHRAFLPPDDSSPQANLQSDPLALKAFDMCTSAASQICSLAEIYDERFGLDKAPHSSVSISKARGKCNRLWAMIQSDALLNSIMHVITLSRRPWDPQATLGLNRCIEACRKMEKLWPTATRLRTLLEGAKVHLDESTYASHSSSRKRSVEDALGSSKNSDTGTSDMYSMPAMDGYPRSASTSTAWDPAHGARMVTHTLGIGGPSLEASSSFYPGYQWWPSQLLTTEGLTHMALSAPVDLPAISAAMSYGPMPSYSHPPPHIPRVLSRQPHMHRSPSTRAIFLRTSCKVSTTSAIPDTTNLDTANTMIRGKSPVSDRVL
ncbi:fungal-specific transcription factor domain-containing protein [Daedaleopsis nitida]|nr:fungal-specific transcription factor domain-containing protein [Daedaleopsis nitida]